MGLGSNLENPSTSSGEESHKEDKIPVGRRPTMDGASRSGPAKSESQHPARPRIAYYEYYFVGVLVHQA